MKKWLCLLMVAVLVTVFLPLNAMADLEEKSFTPSITNAVEMNAKEWFADSYNRALLTWLLSFDYISAFPDDPAPALADVSYVVRDGLYLYVYCVIDDENFMIILYDTSNKTAGAIIWNLEKRIMKSMLTMQDNTYYENDPVDMNEVCEALKEALQ